MVRMIEMITNDDPTGDLYKILDEAGMNGRTLMNTKKSHGVIMNEIRTGVVTRLKDYITKYGQQKFEAGVQSAKPKRIEVQDE